MDLKEFFKDADMILVGIGEKFQDKFEQIKIVDEKNITILEDYARKKYLDGNPVSDVTEAYDKLAKLLEGKNYFVVTLCTDDKIYRSNIKADRIVAPCGSYSYLQCEEVCTENIYSVEEYRSILEHGQEPVCSNCGKKLVMNRIGVKKYSEEGYLEKWNIYMKWLQGSLNKNIRILELGVGMKYPSVIRWPFERVALINNKAKFMRVHKQLFQLTEDIREKGISIEENPVDFLRNQIV